MSRCATSTSPAPTRRAHRPVDAGATHLSRSPSRPRSASAATWVFGTDYATPDGTWIRDYIHVSDLVAAHYTALIFLRQGGRKFTANCGYSRASVMEVIEVVKRVSGREFRVMVDQRRPGDIPLMVANSHRIQSHLGWKPRHDDLDFIISTTLAWEERLSQLGTRGSVPALSEFRHHVAACCRDVTNLPIGRW